MVDGGKGIKGGGQNLLLLVFGGLQRLLSDSMQLNVVDVMVVGEGASVPADDHRGFKEVCSARLQCALLSPAITHRQLPAHVQAPETNTKNSWKRNYMIYVLQMFF